SEERRVGKECRSRWAPDHWKKKRPGDVDPWQPRLGGGRVPPAAVATRRRWAGNRRRGRPPARLRGTTRLDERRGDGTDAREDAGGGVALVASVGRMSGLEDMPAAMSELDQGPARAGVTVAALG